MKGKKPGKKPKPRFRLLKSEKRKADHKKSAEGELLEFKAGVELIIAIRSRKDALVFLEDSLKSDRRLVQIWQGKKLKNITSEEQGILDTALDAMSSNPQAHKVTGDLLQKRINFLLEKIKELRFKPKK